MENEWWNLIQTESFLYEIGKSFSLKFLYNNVTQLSSR